MLRLSKTTIFHENKCPAKYNDFTQLSTQLVSIDLLNFIDFLRGIWVLTYTVVARGTRCTLGSLIQVTGVGERSLRTRVLIRVGGHLRTVVTLGTEVWGIQTWNKKISKCLLARDKFYFGIYGALFFNYFSSIFITFFMCYVVRV